MSDAVGPIGSASSNDMVRANLARHGDDGTALREIEHFAYADPGAGDALDKDTLAQQMGDIGYSVQASANESGGLVFAHDGVVADDSFDEITAWFADIMPQVGWVYDGWSSSVVSGDAGSEQGERP